MPTFDYTAEAPDGGIVRATADAESAEALRARLESKGYSVEEIGPHQEPREPPEESARSVVEAILRTAIEEGVEHIDIEPSADRVTVLYAVGEEHREVMAIPAYVWPVILKGYCLMANAPEAEEGSETGGAFEFEAAGKTVEVLFMGSPSGARLEINPA